VELFLCVSLFRNRLYRLQCPERNKNPDCGVHVGRPRSSFGKEQFLRISAWHRFGMPPLQYGPASPHILRWMIQRSLARVLQAVLVSVVQAVR